MCAGECGVSAIRNPLYRARGPLAAILRFRLHVLQTDTSKNFEMQQVRNYVISISQQKLEDAIVRSLIEIERWPGCFPSY